MNIVFTCPRCKKVSTIELTGAMKKIVELEQEIAILKRKDKEMSDLDMLKNMFGMDK